MFNSFDNTGIQTVGPVLRKRGIYDPEEQFLQTQRNQYTEGKYKKFIYDKSQVGIHNTNHSQYRPKQNKHVVKNVFTRPAPVDEAEGNYKFVDKTIEVRPTFKQGVERIEYYGPNEDFAFDNLVKQNHITPNKACNPEYTAPGVFETHSRLPFAMFSNNKIADPATGLPIIRGVDVDGELGYTTNRLIGEDYSFKDKFNTTNPYTNNLNIFNGKSSNPSRVPRGFSYT